MSDSGLKLRVALQKSGRLSEASIRLMTECGINFDNNRGSERLKSQASNFPLEFLFLRDDDIAGYVADGTVDAGIIGLNILLEQRSEKHNGVKLVEKLGFSKCRLSIAVPKGSAYREISDLNNKRIATSYPNLLKSYLERKNISANIHEISGSVEIATGIGLADAICDLVSSGSTLSSNGLKEAEVILESEAVLIAKESLSKEEDKILNSLVFRIKSVGRAKNNKYILLNAPNESLNKIVEILPGIKSPTIVPLATPGWSSVHSVMHEDEFWEKIENLKSAGAQGILIIPVEKMIL
jgi:ATP phosphoribosyltransferase